MIGDRMTIRRRNRDVILVDEKNEVHDLEACSHAKTYDGLEKPACNCVPCWLKWELMQDASTTTRE